MQDFFTIISNFGFPVAVASYLLFRFEKKLEELEKANENSCLEIKGLKEILLLNNKEILELKDIIVKLKRKK